MNKSLRAEITARLNCEGPIDLRTAAALIPAKNHKGHASPSALMRWIFAGKSLPDGGRLKLEAVRIGGNWMTTRQAVSRFLAVTTGAKPIASPSV